MYYNANIKGPFYRKIAQTCFRLSQAIDPLDGKKHRIFSTTHNLPSNSITPNTENALFVAPSAYIRGNVGLSSHSIVNYNTTLEAIQNQGTEMIIVGANSVIQDLALIKATDGESVIIGRNCQIGANSVIHNSIIEDGVFIGPGSRIINSRVGKEAFIAAGTHLIDGEVEQAKVICGTEAAPLRSLSGNEQEFIEDSLFEQQKLAEISAKYHSLNPGEQKDIERTFLYFDQDVSEMDESNSENSRLARSMGMPDTTADFDFGDYRALTIRELADRRLMRYKEEDYEGVSLDQRPSDLWGAHKPSYERYLEVKKYADSKEGLYTEPDVSLLDKQEKDIEKEIAKKKHPRNKF